ncbi:uncharacterized protein LOC107622115 [Arachis ipaensis]|nr:uncharacterized protein LOC107622115 [Arachis ipaensis]
MLSQLPHSSPSPHQSLTNMTIPNMGTEPIEGTTITLNNQTSPGFQDDCVNLIRKIITNKEINYKTIKNSLMGMWGNLKNVAISEVGRNKVLVSFKDKRTGNRIIKNGPWNVKRHLMNLQRWLYGEAILDVSHDFLEFWIQVHGLPIEKLNAETAKSIGNMIGIVGEVENPIKEGTLQRNFLRIRVAINITQPLQTGFWLNRGDKPKTWISFRYERLLDSYCFKCGVIGHEKKNCDKPVAMACWDTTKPKYEARLAVDRARPLYTTREEEEDWKKHLRENDEARGSQLRGGKEGNSQSSENNYNIQRIKTTIGMETQSGESKEQQTEEKGCDKMVDLREVSRLP